MGYQNSPVWNIKLPLLGLETKNEGGSFIGIFFFFYYYSCCLWLLLLIIWSQKKQHAEKRMERNEWADNYAPSDVPEINHDSVYPGCFPERAVYMNCSTENLGNDLAFCTLIFNGIVISANRSQVKTKRKCFLLSGNWQMHVGISPLPPKKGEIKQKGCLPSKLLGSLERKNKQRKQ